jgi:glycosyltransferase involved in cell wall biosynthesis
MRENWLITGHCACFHQCQRWRSGCGSCPDLNLAPAIPRDGTKLNWQRKRSAMFRSNVHVVAISDYLKQLAEESPILAGKGISRIYNGIDLATFAPASPASRATLRKEFGCNEDENIVLLAGQTVEGIKEGIAAHHAIAALNQLRELPRLRAFVIGHSATQVAAALTIPVTTLPFQETPGQMARCFQAADLSLVTSEVEAFGRIAAESQACTTPVVSFDSGGIPEVVLDQIGGLVVARGDTAALATALSRLVGDASLRARCSRDGMLHVQATFDQVSVAREYATLYRQVVHRFQSAYGLPATDFPTTDVPDLRVKE